MTDLESLRDLETKGYVVVPSFLDAAEIAALTEDFERGAPPSSYPHGFKLVGRRAIAAVWPRMDALLGEVRARSSLGVDRVNFLTVSHYITTTLTERTSYLHQDFDLDYRLTGDHVDYLNFWMPISKPARDKSNVCIVPFDALEARSADAYQRLRGSGGHRFLTSPGETRVFGNYGKILAEGDIAEPELVLDFDIEELVETPPVSAGDLLLMRGDLIHRTQDAATLRIAASIRGTYSKKKITRARADECAAGVVKGDPAAGIHATIQRCFESLGRPEITIDELESFANGVRPA